MNRPSEAPPSPPPRRPSAALRAYLWPALLVAIASLAMWLAFARDTPGERPLTAGDANAPAASTREADAAVAPTRELTGRVVDDRGSPLADARVQVRRTSSESTEPPLADVRSDLEGRFRVVDAPTELLTLEVTREGHESKEQTLRADEAGPITLVLARQGELAVALRDQPGRSVSSAEIVITGPGIWPAQAARASSQGEHVFKGLPAGAYAARARHGSRVGSRSEAVLVVPGERTTVELVLAEGEKLEGTVLDLHTRKPLAGASVSVQDLTPGIDAFTTRSDARGAFAFAGLWPGAVRVEVQREGYASDSRELTLPTSGRVELPLAGAAALSGVVVDEAGEPVSGARLSVATSEGLPLDLASEKSEGQAVGELGVTEGPVPTIPLQPEGEFALGTLAAESDRRGRFRIERLAPGELALYVARSGFVPARVVVRELQPHLEKSEVRVVLKRAGRVLGRIVDARGRALASVYVAAHASGIDQSAVTDARGEYVLRDVLGDVQVEAQPDGHTLLRCRVQVHAGADARCDLTAETAVHALTMRVVDEYGAGLEGARVVLTAGAAQQTSSQVTRRDGTALLRELPAPPYRLDVVLAGYLSVRELVVSEAERELRVELARASTLAGFVVDAQGLPVPSAFVATEDGQVSSETRDDGTFVLPEVAAGTHTLVAQHGSAGTGRSSEVRARPSERLDGIRVVLSGRFLVSAADAATPRRPLRSERDARPDLTLEQRGRVLVVTQVAPSGPAQRAGLRIGDVVSAIDGEPLLSAAHARGVLRDPPGRSAVVRVLRNQRAVNLRYRRPAL